MHFGDKLLMCSEQENGLGLAKYVSVNELSLRWLTPLERQVPSLMVKKLITTTCHLLLSASAR
jgi:hypothetical protein